MDYVQQNALLRKQRMDILKGGGGQVMSFDTSSAQGVCDPLQKGGPGSGKKGNGGAKKPEKKTHEYSSNKEAFQEQVSRARKVHDKYKDSEDSKERSAYDHAKSFLDGAKKHNKTFKKGESGKKLKKAQTVLGMV